MVEGWGLGGMGTRTFLLAFRLHVSFKMEGRISSGFCDRSCSINFCPPNPLITRRFLASGSGKQFCRALVSLGLCKGLLSLSHSSASSWGNSCVGVLTGGTPAPAFPVDCCCYWYCRSPVSCKVLGKDKRWPLAQRA